MIPAPALDRRVVNRAVTAWCAAYHHITEGGPLGEYLGESANEIIERKVRREDNPTLWRAYESEVVRLAVKKLGLKQSGPGARRYRTPEAERARILQLLDEGRTLTEVARLTGRSISLVHNIRKESAA